MKKKIAIIFITVLCILCLDGYIYAAEQLHAIIEINPSTTEVVDGETVTFTLTTKNIVNAEYEKIYAIEGSIEYDKSYFQLESGTIEVGKSGRFLSMVPVIDGEINGTITLKALDDTEGNSVVKFTGLSAGDGRSEEANSTLGIATTENQEFTIKIENGGAVDNSNNKDKNKKWIFYQILIISVIGIISVNLIVKRKK